jgi:hypothetical protein
MAKTRKWRVEPIHKFGYAAPQLFVETNDDRLHKAEAEALKLAKQKSRLSDFNSWSFTAYVIRDEEWIED